MRSDLLLAANSALLGGLHVAIAYVAKELSRLAVRASGYLLLK
jgi:hypothetical protein